MPIIRLTDVEQFAAINLLADGGAIPGKQAIPNCVEIRWAWTQSDGKTAFNVMHARYTPPFNATSATATTLLNGFHSALTPVLPFLDPATSLSYVQLRNLATIDQPYIISDIVPQPGTATGTALPNEVAAVVTFRTGLTGPANRGRLYVPGFSTTALGAGNVIAGTTIAALTTFASGIISTIRGISGWEPCIAQRARNAYVGTSGASHPARAAGTVNITSAVIRDNHWDSMRRRGLK